MKIRRGDIIAFDFPFPDNTGNKVRPVLVVSSNLINERTQNAIVAAISSSVQSATERHVLIDPTTPDGRRTGLKRPSIVQCDKLLTIDKSFILGMIGKLNRELQKHVDDLLRASSDL